MQTLQQELDPAQHGLTASDHPVLRGLMADPATAYAEEVRVLRQRVALLEAELAATKVAAGASALTSVDAAPARVLEHRSVFVEQSAPAVSAVLPATASPPVEPAPTEHTTPPASTPGTAVDATLADAAFAQAWIAEDEVASFEERVAERAFFQASSVDEESRSWLLAD